MGLSVSACMWPIVSCLSPPSSVNNLLSWSAGAFSNTVFCTYEQVWYAFIHVVSMSVHLASSKQALSVASKKGEVSGSTMLLPRREKCLGAQCCFQEGRSVWEHNVASKKGEVSGSTMH